MKNNYLKSKIVLHGETMEDLAKILGITIQTLSLKLPVKQILHKLK